MLVEMKIVLLIMIYWKCVRVCEWMVLLLSLSFNYSYRILWREIVKLGFRPPRVRLETLCRLNQVYILNNAEMSIRTWGEYPLCINRFSFLVSFEILQDRQESARDTGLTAPGDWVSVHSSTVLWGMEDCYPPGQASLQFTLAEAGLKCLVLLDVPAEFWDYCHVRPCWALLHVY